MCFFSNRFNVTYKYQARECYRVTSESLPLNWDNNWKRSKDRRKRFRELFKKE